MVDQTLNSNAHILKSVTGEQTNKFKDSFNRADSETLGNSETPNVAWNEFSGSAGWEIKSNAMFYDTSDVSGASGAASVDISEVLSFTDITMQAKIKFGVVGSATGHRFQFGYNVDPTSPSSLDGVVILIYTDTGDNILFIREGGSTRGSTSISGLLSAGTQYYVEANINEPNMDVYISTGDYNSNGGTLVKSLSISNLVGNQTTYDGVFVAYLPEGNTGGDGEIDELFIIEGAAGTGLTSDAFIQKESSGTLNSNAVINRLESKTLNSNAHIAKQSTPSLNSSASIIKFGEEGSINSDANITVLANTESLNSNANILFSHTGSATVTDFEDTFTRANSPNEGNSEIPGGAWTDVNSSCSISSNELSCSASNGIAYASHTSNVGYTDVRLQFTATFGVVGALGHAVKVGFNVNGGTTNTGVVVDVETRTPGGNNAALIKEGSATRATIANISSILSNGILYYFELDVDGANGDLYITTGDYNSNGGTSITSVSTTSFTQSETSQKDVQVRMSNESSGTLSVGEVRLESLGAGGDNLINSNAYIDIEYSESLNSNANIFAPVSQNIFSDAHIFATGTSSLNSNATIIKLGEEGSINSNANILDTLSESLNSNAFILDELSEALNSDAVINRLESESLNSDAFILDLLSETLDSNAFIKVLGNDQTINSDADIEVLGANTINSDAFILDTLSETLDSNAFILEEFTESLNSDAQIENPLAASLNSNAFILDTLTETLNSDAFIQREESSSLNSDAFISETLSETLDSNANIFKQSTESLNSDAVIALDTFGENINSNASIQREESASLNSNAFILTTLSETLDSNAEVTKVITETIDSNAFILVETPVSLNSNANIEVLGFAININSDANINITQEVSLTSNASFQAGGTTKPKIVSAIEDKLTIYMTPSI